MNVLADRGNVVNFRLQFVVLLQGFCRFDEGTVVVRSFYDQVKKTCFGNTARLIGACIAKKNIYNNK